MKVCPSCGAEYGDEAAFCSRDRSPLRAAAGAAESQGLVGQLVGERYQVERRLGVGGMGEVYLARHVLIGRRCALKVMNQSLSRDADAVSRFNREATSASSISHPNVATVYDFGLTDEGTVYLAMEYIEGRTLSELLAEAGPLSLGRATSLLGQCAAGLEAAHELGIVHRDLKPDNIMVLAGKDRETAKLVDFGIAKAIEGVAVQQVTKSGFVVGTPEYMSPEQLSGDPVDSRSDQYSLALVFYRLLTGKLPFEGSSLQETLVKRLTDPPRPLTVCRPETSFPPGLQAILDKALARRPEQRYASVSEFARAVSAVAATEDAPTRKLSVPVAAADVPATRRVPAAARRHRAAPLAVLGVVLLAGGTWLLLKDRSTPAPVQEDSAGAITQSSSPPDSGLARRIAAVPSGRSTPAPSPIPPPPAPGSLSPDTGQLDLDALDSPSRRAREIARAERQLSMKELSPARQAEAAAFLGTAALYAKRLDSALVFYQLAYRLSPKPSYLKNIQQLRDTIQP